MEDLFFVTLYGGVAMLNAAAAFYLLLRRSNAIAPEVTSPIRLRRWAAAFLMASALSHVLWIFYANHPSPTGYKVFCGLDILLYFPTIAGILLAMLQDRHRPVWPMLVMLSLAVPVWVLSLVRGEDALSVPLGIYVTALIAMMMLFMFFAVRRYGRWLRENYADLENKEIWLSFLILSVFLLFIIIYGNTSLDRIALHYLLQIASIIIVVLLLWRVETLQQLSENEQKSSAPPVIPSSIGPLLKKHCEDGQLYLQHDISIAQLALIIGTNRTYLSTYFAQQGITYNAYINGLRVRHFIRLYHEAVADHRIFTAQQLAFESGYHSYSTFSAAFKQYTGKTVTAWVRGLSA